MAAEEPGEILIELSDQEENRIKEVTRFHTSLVSQATKSPTGEDVQALPFMPGTNLKAKRMIISAKLDAADTIESEESDWTIPIAHINERSLKVEFVNDVKLESFIGFKPSDTADIVVGTARVKTRIAHYNAPDGYLISLGAGRRYHVYLGDDT